MADNDGGSEEAKHGQQSLAAEKEKGRMERCTTTLAANSAVS